jgi:hypothetical protein
MIKITLQNAAFLILIVAFCNVNEHLCAQAQDNAGKESRYYYVGTIGDNFPVQMELVIDSGDVSGSYMYDKVGIPIPLTGEFDLKSSALNMVEQDEKGQKTGTFKGTVRSVGKSFGIYIEGEWSKANGLSTLPFKLTKVADFVSTDVNVNSKYEASYM